MKSGVSQESSHDFTNANIQAAELIGELIESSTSYLVANGLFVRWAVKIK